MHPIIEKIDLEQTKKNFPDIRPGDTVKVHTRVIEGDKERIQIFAGIIISIKGGGLHKSFTVRRISYGEGVERVFPVNSPRVAKVEIVKRAEVRRAKLHYLRGRKGKLAMFVPDAKGKRALGVTTRETIEVVTPAEGSESAQA